MKLRLPFLIILLFSVMTNLWSIDHYMKGDTLYVWAKNGLNLREGPSVSSNKLLIIPYGATIIAGEDKSFLEKGNEEVVLLDCTDSESGKIKNIKASGKWLKVLYNDTEAYVLDVYLSYYSAPKYQRGGQETRMEDIG